LILGVGTDICDARRIAAALKKFDHRFRARIFTEAEVALAGSRSNESLFYAKRFAAKEAVYKALTGAGVAGMGWKDAEITNTDRGAPRVSLSGRCKTALERLTPEGYNPAINLSLSDEPPFAMAFVVISANAPSGATIEGTGLGE
jgi:holo-[acyl-carrier protein] synthase